MRQVVEQYKITGVYGPLIELIRFEPILDTVVEESAKTVLFHVVVENDDVATTILKHMNDQKLPGRVAFLPLNRLSTNVPPPPADKSVFVLASQIMCEPRLQPAINHCFAKCV